ncbi:cell division/cell wall cluster transcriptional repressor MraZ [Mycoplasmopsis cynos]|nr:cell division/cell wall cluster transcriptional repressor MraZ [Mycoplasmopsis felis]WQQ11425.1 cell division/cell wall cluster transcriptional repressor MraZ [Mycoplasmopsis felis]
MYGKFIRVIDDKNRVTLPTAFKEALGQSIVITLGFDGNAEIRSFKDFEKYKENIENQSRFKAETRLLSRFIFGNSYEVKIDSVGRFNIPKIIIDKLTIQKEISFIGVGNLVEIWSKERLDELDSNISLTDIVTIAQKVS